MTDEREKDISSFLNGERLYGDDFGPAEISQWFDAERQGYYDLVQSSADEHAYGYDAINRRHGFSALRGRHFDLCIALGCADGTDVEPIAPQVSRFYCVEPAQQWWKEAIGGTPATYVAPVPGGDLALGDGEADLAVSLGVLHHIPNVSHVLAELARTLRSGGIFVLREPISWMGDWRYPRRGLTKNERGLPLEWLDETMRSLGFSVIRRRLCFFSPLRAMADRVGLEVPYSREWYVTADRALSIAMGFNVRYARRSFIEKCAPSCVFAVYERA